MDEPDAIPWDDIHAAREATLYQQSAYALTVGEPSLATVTVFPAVYTAIHPHLGAHAEKPAVRSPVVAHG